MPDWKSNEPKILKFLHERSNKERAQANDHLQKALLHTHTHTHTHTHACTRQKNTDASTHTYAQLQRDTHVKTHKLTHRVWCTASSWWHTHTHTLSTALSCSLSSSMSVTSSHLYFTHTHSLYSELHTPTHTHRQMSSTLKLNGWPDGESLSFSNKDLSLLSLHPPLSPSDTHTHRSTHVFPHLPSCMCTKHTHTHTHTHTHRMGV